jgi:hypothetical protein
MVSGMLSGSIFAVLARMVPAPRLRSRVH